MPERKGKSTANKKHTTAPVPVMGDVQEEEDEEKTFFKDASDNAAAQEAACYSDDKLGEYLSEE
jgi:hypothetical protein